MQKLKILNIRGESIEFGMHSPYLLSHVEGLGIPQGDIYSTQAPGQDGSTFHDLLLGERIISAKVTIMCKDRKELYFERKKLMSLLTPKQKLILLYTNDYKTFRTYACIDEGVDFKERINNSGVADISFTCSNPYWLDEKDNVRKIKYFDEGIKFPLTFKTQFAEAGYSKIVKNDGDVDVGCILEYIGAAENPKIVNETTGEFIKVNKTLETGDKLVINTARGEETVDIIKNDGTKTNVFNWIDLESTFFKLKIGENRITYSADNDISKDVSVNVIYSNSYVGV